MSIGLWSQGVNGVHELLEVAVELGRRGRKTVTMVAWDEASRTGVGEALCGSFFFFGGCRDTCVAPLSAVRSPR